MLKRLRYRLEYAAAMIVMSLFRIFPLLWVSRIAGFLGGLAYFLFRKRRAIAFANLDRAFAGRLSLRKKKSVLYKSFQHMLMSVIELFLIHKVIPHPENFFTIHGQEHLDKAHQKGKGTMFAISHIGSWEYLSLVSNMTGYAAAAVVKSIRNPLFDKKIKELRGLPGLEVIHKDAAAREVMRRLKKNYVVAILTDQWAGPDGLWVNFFGELTSCTSIPARFALKTGCAIIPAYCVRVAPWKFEIHIQPEIPLESSDLATTASLNRVLENQILAYPEQWTWVHRRWKNRPMGNSVRRQ